VRLTFLSDQWLPFTTELSGEDVASLQPRRVAWFSGGCGKPEFHKAAGDIPSKKAFWNLECEGEPRPLALAPQPLPLQDAVPKVEFREPGKPFYKNKWLWVGVGLVTAAIIVIQSQKKDEKTEPTTTYGY